MCIPKLELGNESEKALQKNSDLSCFWVMPLGKSPICLKFCLLWQSILDLFFNLKS
jgi:hypothetical protein